MVGDFAQDIFKSACILSFLVNYIRLTLVLVHHHLVKANYNNWEDFHLKDYLALVLDGINHFFAALLFPFPIILILELT